ncbi:hypothetical protein [Aurantibacillus circumpalustris]|uniref:hypothetical protein n=1 Tax=Aurantibacillus circumpalustris TaxID=3036359 RepID=UPI00295AA0CC|nr:hypothetical protein [Aurantibacillus circumpalustris]
MKKLLFATVTCLSMTSCVKNYKCECVSESGEIGSTSSSSTTTTIRGRKSTAESFCKTSEYNYTDGNYINKTECSLK